MRIAVVGAGGTGGYFGGMLARAGEDVTFIARGAQLEAIRAWDLTLESSLAGTFTAPVQATDEPGGVGAVELILLMGVLLVNWPRRTAEALVGRGL